jgi:hypothetical protein
MRTNGAFRRVVVVILDGLRANLLGTQHLPSLGELRLRSAWTDAARTVTPTVTSAAMTSLFTGVSPGRHGVGAGGFGIPRNPHRLRPITRILAAASQPSSLFIARIPFHQRFVAGALGLVAGWPTFHAAGTGARDVLHYAGKALREQMRGMIFLHLVDADEAGHAHGWGSPEYLRAAGVLDEVVGEVADVAGVGDGTGTLLIALADHGGGGVDPRDHESEHPLDRTIPLLIAGDGVRPGRLPEPVSLLDVPATLLWSLGHRVPDHYEGRVLAEAMSDLTAAAA